MNDLEPMDTVPEPIVPALGFCFWCNELVMADEPFAYFPPAHSSRLACVCCITRRDELGEPG